MCGEDFVWVRAGVRLALSFSQPPTFTSPSLCLSLPCVNVCAYTLHVCRRAYVHRTHTPPHTHATCAMHVACWHTCIRASYTTHSRPASMRAGIIPGDVQVAAARRGVRSRGHPRQSNAQSRAGAHSQTSCSKSLCTHTHTHTHTHTCVFCMKAPWRAILGICPKSPRS